MKNKTKSKRRGGAATVFPLKWYHPDIHTPSAPAGRDLLEAIPPLGIRPKIGGGNRTKKRIIKNRRKSVSKKRGGQRGGFVPSVMGNFVAAASQYIAPLALFAGYKLMTRKRSHKK